MSLKDWVLLTLYFVPNHKPWLQSKIHRVLYVFGRNTNRLKELTWHSGYYGPCSEELNAAIASLIFSGDIYQIGYGVELRVRGYHKVNVGRETRSAAEDYLRTLVHWADTMSMASLAQVIGKNLPLHETTLEAPQPTKLACPDFRVKTAVLVDPGAS